MNCAKFGMEANLYPTRNRTLVPLFFKTGADIPYTKYHYQVKVNLANPSNADNTVYGDLKLSLFGTKGQLTGMNLMRGGSVDLSHGEHYQTLVIEGSDVGKIQRIELNWKFNSGIFHPCGLFCNSNLYVSSVEVSELSNYPEASRLEHTFRTCPVNANYAEIRSGSTFDFYPTAC